MKYLKYFEKKESIPEIGDEIICIDDNEHSFVGMIKYGETYKVLKTKKTALYFLVKLVGVDYFWNYDRFKLKKNLSEQELLEIKLKKDTEKYNL